MRRRVGLGLVTACATAAACSGPSPDSAFASGSATASETDASGSGGNASLDDTGGDNDTGGFVFDVGSADQAGGVGPTCKVVEDGLDAAPDCTHKAPPDAFAAEVQWSWDGGCASFVTPLVINLTDDNGDGEIDLCDTPDIVLVCGTTLYVLDGATGSLHFDIPTPVDWAPTPAVGDIDNDGLPEIVGATWGGNPPQVPQTLDQHLVAFEHDGSLKWTASETWANPYPGSSAVLGAIALADLDNDGDVEILADMAVHDHKGQRLWTALPPNGPPPEGLAPTAADLDGDGDLEVLFGHVVHHHDGTIYFQTPAAPFYWTDLPGGYPQVANLDDDPEPEVLITGLYGISVVEHDGTPKYLGLNPTIPGSGVTGVSLRPATIHDFDGDGKAEYAVSARTNYSVYGSDASVVWTATVLDESGGAGGTAFDFLGDGTAEAMYADEYSLFVFDADGIALVTEPRTSLTAIEYPVVADVDNDNSAEIVVVSNQGYGGEASPSVQVFRDKQDRWIPARRIWNQHTYHVTNVREDGTIPQFEQPHWKQLNTFRTNAQIEGGSVCQPPPRG